MIRLARQNTFGGPESTLQLTRSCKDVQSATSMRENAPAPICDLGLVTDNGTNFVSQEFEKFLVDNFIHHVKTPPGHHQSNGQAEFKLYLEKSNSLSLADLNRDVVTFCLHYNTTPAADESMPMHFVFQQHICTRLTVLCTEKDHPYLPSPA